MDRGSVYFLEIVINYKLKLFYSKVNLGHENTLTYLSVFIVAVELLASKLNLIILFATNFLIDLLMNVIVL